MIFTMSRPVICGWLSQFRFAAIATVNDLPLATPSSYMSGEKHRSSIGYCQKIMRCEGENHGKMEELFLKSLFCATHVEDNWGLYNYWKGENCICGFLDEHNLELQAQIIKLQHSGK